MTLYKYTYNNYSNRVIRVECVTECEAMKVNCNSTVLCIKHYPFPPRKKRKKKERENLIFLEVRLENRYIYTNDVITV